MNSQQYADIFNQPIIDPVTGEETNQTLADILSTQNKALEINDILLAQAEADAPKSGYDTQHYYTLAVDKDGNAALETTDATDIDASNATQGLSASGEYGVPKRLGYSGFLLGDGIPTNGAYFGHGITFPNGPVDGDYFLRTDFLPNRLFRYDGNRWVKREDALRTSMTPSATRNTQKGTFINNGTKVGVNLLAGDVTTVYGTSIVTNVNYVDGMYADVALENSAYVGVPVITNVGGKAAITLDENFVPGSKVDWRLYQRADDEKQALSKALRPKKPLADL